MRKGTVFFHPIEGSGSLTISWTSGPKGDAVEAKKGSGVGFFSDSGALLCVIFDEIQASQDQQTLEFNRYRIELFVKNSKVTYSVAETKPKLSPRKKRAKRRQPT
jgi:hypothetical protein